MDFEQRIDRLTERHEALTQTVELLALNVNRLEENVNRLEEKVERLADSQIKNEVLFAQIGEDIRSLATIAQLHEDRIRNLERGRG